MEKILVLQVETNSEGKIIGYTGISETGDVVCFDTSAKKKQCNGKIKNEIREFINEMEKSCDCEPIEAKEFFNTIDTTDPYFAHWFTPTMGHINKEDVQKLFDSINRLSDESQRVFNIDLSDWAELYTKFMKLFEFLSSPKALEGYKLPGLAQIVRTRINNYLSIVATPTTKGAIVNIEFHISSDLDVIILYKKLKSKELIIDTEEAMKRLMKKGFHDHLLHTAMKVIEEYNRRVNYIFS